MSSRIGGLSALVVVGLLALLSLLSLSQPVLANGSTLVLLDDMAIKSTHSLFFKGLQSNTVDKSSIEFHY